MRHLRTICALALLLAALLLALVSMIPAAVTGMLMAAATGVETLGRRVRPISRDVRA